MSSGFISENDLAEAKKRRQEEWEKVRTAEQPLERPEESLEDCRPLYERLREQKMKKDLEYEESRKLKNLVSSLDDDEAQFLSLVDKHKVDTEKTKIQEEREVLKEYRDRVMSLQEESAKKALKELVETKAKPSSTSTSGSKNSQKALLGLGVKRKIQDTKSTQNNASTSSADKEQVTSTTFTTCSKATTLKNGADTESSEDIQRNKLKKLISIYSESSDSKSGSDSD